MATITCLPDEVIAIVLGDDNISIKDVVSFSSTCKRFQRLTQSNKFWEKKFYQRCPSAKKKYNIEKQKKIFNLDFKEHLKAGIKCIKNLQHYVSLMSDNNLIYTNKKKLECLLRSIVEDSMTYYFVSDELNRISAQLSWQLDSNLTNRYNFGLLFHYLKQYRFIYKQIKFINMPKEKQLLEHLLTIVAQYFQLHVSYSVIKTWLDDIAQEILSRLKNKYPAHSIFSTSSEKFSFWRDNNINDNFWNPTEATQIMRILEEFIFSDLEVHKLFNQLLIKLDLEDKYINYILKCLRKYLLTTTYHSVARRLGIHCAVMPNEYCTNEYYSSIEIVWKPNYNTEDSKYTEYFFMIEDFQLVYPSNIIRGRSNYNKQFSSLNYTWITLITRSMLIYFYQELIGHNIHCKWKFNILFNFLRRCLIVENINIETEYRNIINTIEVKSDIAIKEQPKSRKEEIKFAVGMIVTHSWQLYSPFNAEKNNHDGVIIGWHSKCDRMFLDELKKTLMFPYLRQCYEYYHICICKKSSNSVDQPHYIILAENNKICYVQQDDISICSPKSIDNIEIGRYFCRFEGTHYVPNESLAKHYPSNTAAILKILSNQ